MSQNSEKRFDKLGYGALALYVSLIGVMGLAVYGINLTGTIMDQNRSDRARAEVQTGRMVVSTEDRTQCRSIRFDNETAELGRETLTDCDVSVGPGSGGSLGGIRNSFNKR